MPLKLFDILLKSNGYPIEKAKTAFTQLLPLNTKSIDVRKEAIVAHHQAHNAFYKSIAPKKNMDWEQLPVLTKRDLQQPLRMRLSTGYHPKNIYTGKTSGSSGHPFIFAKDKNAHAIAWAAFHHAYAQHGINLNNSLQARFYGIPLVGKGKYSELLKDFLSNRVRFSIFNMDEKVLDGYVSRFRESEFQYINGYTSSILLLAKHCAKRHLVLRNICPSLTCCIVTSEMLFPEDKVFMESWLGVPVINEYGASEVGLIAMQNTQGKFLVNHQNLFIEVVDTTNKPVPAGQSGRILVTDLYNLAHPMIRYEIGDIGTINTLENGAQVLESLQGRTSDIARLPSGKVVPGLTFYYVTKTIIDDDAQVLEFVIIQKQPALFEIQYVSSVPMDNVQKTKIQHAMDRYLEPSLSLIFTQFTSLDRSHRGKLKQFTSEV